MQISPVKFYSPNLTFKNSDQDVLSPENGELLYRNTTWMFRDDIKWDELARTIDENFKKEPHVNVFNFACSDGSEPYSLAISLIENTSNAGKFFPIIAKDIDETMIKNAQSGNIKFNSNDKNALNENNIELKKYFTDLRQKINLEDTVYHNYTLLHEYNFYKVNDYLKNMIHFDRADVMRDIENLDFKTPCVFMLRNVLPYFDEKSQAKLLHSLGKMKEGSLLILGDFDFQGYSQYKMKELLRCENFKYMGNHTYKKCNYSL